MAKAEINIKDNSKWLLYDKFQGLNTDNDPEKIEDGESPEAMNTSVNDGDRLSLRNKGYEKIGDLSEYGTTDGIKSMHTFRRRDGQNIMMASFGTYMTYFNPSSLTWEVIKDDYSDSLRFGYADYTLHTDTSSYVYFGNGVDYFSRWSGNYAKLVADVNIGDSLIEMDDLTGWPNEGQFNVNGTSITYVMKGELVTVELNDGGSGYSVNDVLTIVQSGASAGTLTVTGVTGGVITSFDVTTVGTNYYVEDALATTVAPPGGTGAIVNITAIDSNNTVTLLSTSTKALASGRGVSEAPEIKTGATYPKGNIYLMANNRLFISGVTTSPQAVYFSVYGDPLDFSSTALVTASTATASGTFNLAEGGGAVTGMIFDEGSIYAFKRTMIYKITLTDALYVLQQIKPFDGKSQTIGGIAPKCIFTGSNYVFFITPDKQIMSLERVENIDYPQNVPISDKISPDIKNANNDDAAGITFNDYAYFSTKQDTSVDHNNVVYVWNITKKMWDPKITGWNAGDLCVYDNGTTEDLYFGSSNTTNVYKVINDNIDDVYDVNGNWKSKQYTFQAPYAQKVMTDLFIEGYITEETSLTITLYLDDDGFTQQLTTTLKGTETDYQFSTGDYNKFGINPFGIEVIGSNEDFTWLTKFRIYLNKDFRLKPFYNCQIEFQSEGKNNDWEVLNYAFKVGAYSKEENRKLLKSFAN